MQQSLRALITSGDISAFDLAWRPDPCSENAAAVPALPQDWELEVTSVSVVESNPLLSNHPRVELLADGILLLAFNQARTVDLGTRTVHKPTSLSGEVFDLEAEGKLEPAARDFIARLLIDQAKASAILHEAGTIPPKRRALIAIEKAMASA